MGRNQRVWDLPESLTAFVSGSSIATAESSGFRFLSSMRRGRERFGGAKYLARMSVSEGCLRTEAAVRCGERWHCCLCRWRGRLCGCDRGCACEYEQEWWHCCLCRRMYSEKINLPSWVLWLSSPSCALFPIHRDFRFLSSHFRLLFGPSRMLIRGFGLTKTPLCLLPLPYPHLQFFYPSYHRLNTFRFFLSAYSLVAPATSEFEFPPCGCVYSTFPPTPTERFDETNGWNFVFVRKIITLEIVWEKSFWVITL
jgi:hypothetical protein